MRDDYVRLCEEMELEPDEKILQAMHAILVFAGVLTSNDEE